MRKITLSLVALLITGAVAFSQAVADQAIIPVSVSLNSILRLNVTSGGNIEFVVNTITDYSTGIANTARYDTKFTVASSVDFNVLLYAEDLTMIGTDNPAHTLALANVGYQISVDGTGTEGTNWDITSDGTTTVLTSTATTEAISAITGFAAGDVAKNAFTINWELCTAAVRSAAGGVGAANTLLAQSKDPDRYTTNVFLVLVKD